MSREYGVLLVSAVLVVVLEGFRGSASFGTAPSWPVLQALVSAVALCVVWRNQEQLRLWPLLGLVFAFQLSWIVLHLSLHVHSDYDSIKVYPREGEALLAGDYPSSEYPPGAVVLFALESLLGGRTAEGVRVANAFLMVPFQLVTVAAIWQLRTRWSAWFAALIGLWPLNAFFWEFRLDLAPTAALAIGLLLAWRERWLLAGVALGIGAAIKWTPALSAGVLIVWLLSSHRTRGALRHALGCAGAFLLVNAPFLVLWPGRVVHAYREQGTRGLTAESFMYLPLRLLGVAKQNGGIFEAATVPRWAGHRRGRVSGALHAHRFRGRGSRGLPRTGRVPLAALAPVMFLLSNKVFSPQYLVTMVAAWAIAGAIVARSAREELLIATLIFGATVANELVTPRTPRTGQHSPRWHFSADSP